MSADERAAAIAAALDRLNELTLDELRQDWRRRWGEPPKYRSKDLLMRAIAYRLQAAQFGDLPKASAAQVRDLAARFTADRKFTPVPGPVIKPGTTLIRDWGGLRHVGDGDRGRVRLRRPDLRLALEGRPAHQWGEA